MIPVNAYIPVNALLSKTWMKVDQIESSKTNGMMLISPAPFSLMQTGSMVAILPFQFAPSELSVGGRANYITHSAKGVRQFAEYINTELEDFPLKFTVANSVHSTFDAGRLIKAGGTNDIDDDVSEASYSGITIKNIIDGIKSLVMPTDLRNRPPDVRIVFGTFFEFNGFAVSYSIKTIATYGDMTPKIVEIDVAFKGKFNE